MTRKLLVTDDDPLLLALYKSSLKNLTDVEITYAPSLESARRLLATEKYEMALLDLNLCETHGHEGFQLLQDIRNSQRAAVVMMSSDDDDATIAECVRRGAAGFIPKRQGFARQLPEVVRRTLSFRRPAA
jgi:DNA-binding NarL/FixJ family response regulator